MQVSDETLNKENLEHEQPVTEIDAIEEAELIQENDVVDDEALSAEPTLEEQLALAQAEAAKNLEGWQRTLAEFSNARKRLERQRADAYTNALIDIATKLLPIVDDFDRLVANAPTDIGENEWFTGLQLVQRKMLGTFDYIKLEPIDALGQPFDPNQHEAIMQEPSDEYESGTVINVFQTGYKMGERIIRPAVVVVAA
jgi:molecular chaperone GrpE